MFSLPNRMLSLRVYRIAGLTGVILALLLVLRTWAVDFSIGRLFTQERVSYGPEQHGKELYGVMFDAGSTGSRIHVFHFRELPGGHTRLVSEYFDETKPGLSSYHTKPKEGANSIGKLLENAQDKIPADKFKESPVALKATAGLRLLSTNDSIALLHEVRQLFKSSPFVFGNVGDVAIMDGLDEGVFAWITVNFLKGAFDHMGVRLVGIMDLGGGSTQIAFSVGDMAIKDELPSGFSHSVGIFGDHYNLYCHSYLGLGLMSARDAILAQGKVSDSSRKSSCFPSDFKSEWKFGGNILEISGDDNYGFDSCFEQAVKVVSQVHKLDEIKQRKFYFFSYYYDRAVDLRLIDETQGGVITLSDFIAATKRECSARTSPFLCLDAVYISALLQKGYQFKDSTQLTLRKKINDVEISWALGATLDLFDKRRNDQ